MITKVPKRKSRTAPATGFTLAETLVTIGLAAVLLVVYSVILSGTIFIRRSQYNAQAASLVQEQLDSLRLLPATELLDRTDGNFLNLAVNRGNWLVLTKSGDGQDKRLTLPTAQTSINGETALMVLPTNWQEDFTFSAKVRVLTASPGGWGIGLVFHYRDTENYYRFRYTSGGLSLDIMEKGVITTLWSQSLTMDKETWYTLEVVTSGSDITIKKNSSPLTTISDMTFYKGELGLVSFDEALTEFDDVSLTVDAVTSSWNFEANDESAYPEDWRRYAWSDLPSGTGTLTIADYLEESSMKQATVNISWDDGDTTRTVTGTTVIKN